MDAKAVTERSKALQKAMDQGEPAATLVSIIKELNKGVNATEDLLRTTKIGSVINRLKTHKNAEVANTARDTVTKWRAEVQRKRDSLKTGHKPGTPKSGTASPAPGSSAGNNNNSSSNGGGGGGSKSNPDGPSVKPENRTWQSDKVDIARTSSDTRDRCVGMMYNGLVFLETKPANSILTVALAIEEAAYKKFSPETSQGYKDKMRELFLNLKNKTDSSLRAKVLLGEISPARLVSMSHEELKSKKAREEEEKIRVENMDKAEMPKDAPAFSDHLECGKCKQKKVSYTQAQTRSADEPMTTFCTCTVCGNRWKFS